MPPSFSVDTFLAYFPEFAKVADKDSGRALINACGMRAVLHFGSNRPGFPTNPEHREYARCLIAAHLYVLATRDNEGNDDSPEEGDIASAGALAGGMMGSTFKATVGSVSVENTKPNTFTSDEWTWWYNQTKYGSEYLAFLSEVAAPVYLNTRRDSVRDLL